MKYKVKGTRTIKITYEIEADSPDGAEEIASSCLLHRNEKLVTATVTEGELNDVWAICPKCNEAWDPYVMREEGCPDCRSK